MLSENMFVAAKMCQGTWTNICCQKITQRVDQVRDVYILSLYRKIHACSSWPAYTFSLIETNWHDVILCTVAPIERQAWQCRKASGNSKSFGVTGRDFIGQRKENFFHWFEGNLGTIEYLTICHKLHFTQTLLYVTNSAYMYIYYLR